MSIILPPPSTGVKIGIYGIHCSENDQWYVGRSRHIYERWMHHISKLRNQRHKNMHLQRAFDKYSEDSFSFTILEECELDRLAEREFFWVKELNSMLNGFNSTSGGDTGDLILKEDTKEKISKSLKNRIFTDEHRQKLSEANRRRFQNPREKERASRDMKSRWENGETRNKLAAKGKKPKDPESTAIKRKMAHEKRSSRSDWKIKISNTLTGRKREAPVSNDTKQKLSESTKRAWDTGKHDNAVNKMHKLTIEQARDIRTLYASGNFKQEELAKRYNVSKSLISQVILNIRYVESQRLK